MLAALLLTEICCTIKARLYSSGGGGRVPTCNCYDTIQIRKLVFVRVIQPTSIQVPPPPVGFLSMGMC